MTRGEHMKEARRKAGLTINELAKLSTVSGTTISRLERGDHLGAFETVAILAKALGLTIDEYVGRNNGND
jgi:transcriptional regulator with XRE-family HTH domain